MKRRMPARRLDVPRSSDNDKRRLREPVPAGDWLEAFARRAAFEGYSKHKSRPRAFGLEPFAGPAEDATTCDGHADFGPQDIVRVPELLRRGILAGLVGANTCQGDPTLVWLVMITAGFTKGGSRILAGRSTMGTRFCRTKRSREK